MKVSHDGVEFECELHESVPVIEALAHDFLLCPHLGKRHLVLREVTPRGLMTLWDCDGNGHVYSTRDVVDIARPNVTAEARQWPDMPKDWHDRLEAANLPPEELS